MTNLSVNINKVATLRNARGGNIPNVLKFAIDCEKFGAQGITVHPRPDERHIRYQDAYDLKPIVIGAADWKGAALTDSDEGLPVAELVTYLKDGNEVISKVPSKTLSIDKDGTFSMADSQTALGQITTSYIHGDWTLETEKTTLSLLQDGLDIPVTYTIKELKNKTLVLEQYTSQGVYLMTFEPQNN